MLFAGLMFSSMVAFVKFLGTRLPSYEIVFFRSTIQLFSMIAVFWKIGFSSLKTNRPLLHGVRAFIAVVLINCNFYAFTQLPIADVTAIGFSRNLFLVILAFFFLGERIKPHNLVVTVIGFVGVLIITRPGFGHFSVAVWVAIAGAGLGATMMMLIRMLTFSESNQVMMTYPSIATVLVTSLPTWFGWISPTLPEILCILAMSYTGILGQWSMIQAFRLGEATAVAPASYIRIVFASIIGLLFFSEIPDFMTITGAAIIITSNLVLIRQERNVPKKEPRRVPGDVT